MLSRRKRRNEFEAIAIPHMDALYGAAHRLTRNPRDAEDLVQEAMLRAYRFWDSFQKDSNCKAWLFRILTNTFINSYQKRKRTREVLDAAVAEQKVNDGVLVHERAHAQRNPEGLLLERALSDDVTSALEELPPDFRVAVMLCDVQGFSYKEIAEIVGCPVGTVMSRLFRGRRLLKDRLHDFAVEQGIIRSDEQAPGQAPAPAAQLPGGETIDLDAYRKQRNH